MTSLYQQRPTGFTATDPSRLPQRPPQRNPGGEMPLFAGGSGDFDENTGTYRSTGTGQPPGAAQLRPGYTQTDPSRMPQRPAPVGNGTIDGAPGGPAFGPGMPAPAPQGKRAANGSIVFDGPQGQPAMGDAWAYNKVGTTLPDGGGRNPIGRGPDQNPFPPAPNPQQPPPAPGQPPPTTPPPDNRNPIWRDPNQPIPNGPGFPGPNPNPGGNPIRRDPSDWRSRTGGYTQPVTSPGWDAIPGWGEQGEGEGRNFGRSGTDPRLDAMYDWALRESQARYQDTEGRTFYEGQTVAGFDPRELLAQQMLQGAGREQRGLGLGSANYTNTLMGRAANPQDDPTLNSAIDLTLKDIAQQTTDPGGVFSQIRGNALENGSYGGTRQGVLEGVAGGRMADVMAKTAANMRLEGRGQNLNAARDAMGQLNTTAGLLGSEAGAYSAAGAQSRDMDQRFKDDALRRWSYNVTEPDRRLDSLFQRTGQADLGKWQSGSQYMSPLAMDALEEGISQGPGGAQQALGWLSALAGIYNQVRT